MKKIPVTENTLVLRTDYSNEEVWKTVRDAMLAPVQENGFEFQAYVDIIEDPDYQDMTIEEVMKSMNDQSTFLFIVDNFTIVHHEHPIICVDLYDEPGRSFRLIPSELAGVENNLSIANMDFFEFGDNIDPDGIFRGFDR